MKGVIIHEIKHKFGADKHISDLSRPLERIRVIGNTKYIGELTVARIEGIGFGGSVAERVGRHNTSNAVR